jgi:hypothetical protein
MVASAKPGRTPRIAKTLDALRLGNLGKARRPIMRVTTRTRPTIRRRRSDDEWRSHINHRGDDPQLGAILQAKRDRSLNHHLLDGFERLARQPIEAAVERVMLGLRIAVEIGESTQRHTVDDLFAQRAIIPVLDQRAPARVSVVARIIPCVSRQIREPAKPAAKKRSQP